MIEVHGLEKHIDIRDKLVLQSNRTDITVLAQQEVLKKVWQHSNALKNHAIKILREFYRFVCNNRVYDGERLYDQFFLASLSNYHIRDIMEKPKKNAFIIIGHHDYEGYPESCDYLIPKDWMINTFEFLERRYEEVKSRRRIKEKTAIEKEKEEILKSLEKFITDDEFGSRVLDMFQ